MPPEIVSVPCASAPSLGKRCAQTCRWNRSAMSAIEVGCRPSPLRGPAIAITRSADASASIDDWSEAALAQALRAIVTRQMRQGSAAHGFARYLFRTLLGDAWWAAIRDRAGGADELELALCWPADLHLMSRLPWELARIRERGQERFLAEASEPRVAITRMVAGARAVPELEDGVVIP